MGSRLELHEELCDLLGSRNVYFQPPESKKLTYDCIVYARNSILTQHANDKNLYIGHDRYELIYIYKDPDSKLNRDFLERFQYCSLNRHFVSDNLYHDVFNLYY